MGANVSKTTQSVLMEKTTNIVNNVLTTYATKNSNKINTSQVTNIINGKGAIYECSGNIEIKQVINTTFSALMNASNEDKKEMSNQIVQQLDAAVKTAIQQENTGINFGQANVNWSDSSIQQKVNNSVQNALTTTIENSLKNSVDGSQQINFINEGIVRGANCIYNQGNTTYFLSQMITKNIANNLIANVDDTLMSATSTTEVKQTNAGLNWPWIGGGIFGVIGFALFVFIVYKVMKKKNNG